jgi:hypothetical protein
LIATKDEGVLQREEILFELLAYLVKENHSLRQRAVSLQTQKSSTREEILRRLFLATDFIYSDVTRSHSLDDKLPVQVSLPSGVQAGVSRNAPPVCYPT